MNLWFNWFSNSCESLPRQFPMCMAWCAKWRRQWRRRLCKFLYVYLLSQFMMMIECKHHKLASSRFDVASLQLVAANFLTANSNYWCEMIGAKRKKNLLSIFFWIPIRYVPIIMIIISLIQICNLLLLLSLSLSLFRSIVIHCDGFGCLDLKCFSLSLYKLRIIHIFFRSPFAQMRTRFFCCWFRSLNRFYDSLKCS